MINFNLTEERIERGDLLTLEQTLEYPLPEAYKVHVLKFNGGTPSKKYFKGKSIAFFNSIKNGEDTLEENIIALKDLLPKGYIPFAYDAGGNQICMDLREGENYGKIYYLPMDMGDIDPEFLANSFEEFMSGLSLANNY